MLFTLFAFSVMRSHDVSSFYTKISAIYSSVFPDIDLMQ
jgi:hypothetical protein